MTPEERTTESCEQCVGAESESELRGAEGRGDRLALRVQKMGSNCVYSS